MRAAEQERPDVALARAQWQIDRQSLDPARLVFIDETGTWTNMTRLYGRARRGRRVVGHAPWGHWKTVTFVAALRQDAITAPFVIDRPMNAVIFVEYVRQCLVPTLQPGDIVSMDNLSVHKVEQVRQLIEATGAEPRYLPSYSPDFNPIEQAFAKLKAHLRKARERTIPALYDRIGTTLDLYTPQECQNYFANSGYAST